MADTLSQIRKIPLRNVGSEQETRSVAFLLYKRAQESLPESLSGQEKETRLTLYFLLLKGHVEISLRTPWSEQETRIPSQLFLAVQEVKRG